MKNAMKGFISLVLAFGILLGMTACGGSEPIETIPTFDSNFPEQFEFPITDAEPADEGSKGKYEDQLEVWDEEAFMDFYGSVDDLLVCGSSLELYADGIMYHDPAIKDDAFYAESWNIGEGFEILSFDYSIIVAKDADGNLWAFGSDSMDETTGEKNVCSMQLACTEENYVYGFHPVSSAEFACIYLDENGECVYELYDLLAGEITMSSPLLCKLDDTPYAVKDMYNSFSTTTRVVLTNGTYCGAGTSYRYEDDGTYIVGKESRTLENVDAVHGTDAMAGVFLSFIDDNTAIYACDWMSGELKQVSIPMPDGYTLDDMESFTSEDAVIIKFSDGSYYFVDTGDVYDAANGEAVPLQKVEELDGLSDHVVRVICDFHDILAVMDDGYIYEVCSTY